MIRRDVFCIAREVFMIIRDDLIVVRDDYFRVEIGCFWVCALFDLGPIFSHFFRNAARIARWEE